MKLSFGKESIIQNWIEQAKYAQPPFFANDKIFQSQIEQVLGILFSVPTTELLGIKNNVIRSIMEEASTNITMALIQDPQTLKEVEKRVAKTRNILSLRINTLLYVQKNSQKN
jgi:hypothetical protein